MNQEEFEDLDQIVEDVRNAATALLRSRDLTPRDLQRTLAQDVLALLAAMGVEIANRFDDVEERVDAIEDVVQSSVQAQFLQAVIKVCALASPITAEDTDLVASTRIAAETMLARLAGTEEEEADATVEETQAAEGPEGSSTNEEAQ